jgi:PAS domain S-box-containing protein
MTINSAHTLSNNTETLNSEEQTSFFKKDAFATFDHDFTILSANSTFINILGIKDYNPIGTSLLNLPFFQEAKYSTLCESLRDREIEQFKSETSFLSLDDIRINLEATVIAHEDNDDKGGILIIRDISQEKVAEEMLRASRSALSQSKTQIRQMQGMSRQLKSFLYVASHDLKEPLRTIGNFSQLLNRQCHGYIDDTGREYLSFIMDGVKNMNALIDDLLHYSELDARKHIPQDVHLPTMMFMLEKMQEKNIKAAGGNLVIKEMPETILADKAKIRQLFEALLSNAIKFRHPNRPLEIELSGKEIENGYEFSFTDNGIGIKKEFFGKIFEMFKRLHSRKEYEGTGIGLALCKKIVEQHGGEINIQSTLGEGSIFTFSIMRHNV